MKRKYDFSKAKKAKKSKDLKVIKTFRLDPEILNWLEVEGEKQGMGYQTFLNWFLRKSMDTMILLRNGWKNWSRLFLERKHKRR